MNIPLPNSQKNDVLDLGFDKNLNRISTDPKSDLRDSINDSDYNYWGNGNASIDSKGNATFNNINIGRKNITIDPASSLASAINDLSSAGGGVLHLKAGTYNVTTTINIPSNISIIGENQATTFISFGSTSAYFNFIGSSVYTTGTITAITSGVVVTGNGTAWLTNAKAGQQMFIKNRWYTISAVNSDTSITLAEIVFNPPTYPASYRIASPITSIRMEEVTLKLSTGSALKFTDARNVILSRVSGIQSNIGFDFTNVSELSLEDCLAIANTSHGISIVNAALIAINSCLANGNGGYGLNLNNVDNLSVFASTHQSNTLTGASLTSVTNTAFGGCSFSGNGGKGVEMVSGNSGLGFYHGNVVSNTSDGIKLTASTSGVIINSMIITGNGGYGINIAASSCASNTIIAPYYSSNTSGNLNDLGTGTNNIAVSTASTGVTQSFIYGETIAINDSLYFSSTDGKVYKTSSSFTDQRIYNFIGFAKEAGVSGYVGMVQISGVVTGLSSLTAYSTYYLGTTAGTITATNPANVKTVGVALSSTSLLITTQMGVLNQKIIASATLRQSADTSQTNTTATPTKLKEIKVYKSGTYRVSYSFGSQSGGFSALGQVYRNGVAYGVQRNVTTTPSSYSEDLWFSENDLVQYYCWVGTSNGSIVLNFRLSYDLSWDDPQIPTVNLN